MFLAQLVREFFKITIDILDTLWGKGKLKKKWNQGYMKFWILEQANLEIRGKAQARMMLLSDTKQNNFINPYWIALDSPPHCSPLKEQHYFMPEVKVTHFRFPLITLSNKPDFSFALFYFVLLAFLLCTLTHAFPYSIISLYLLNIIIFFIFYPVLLAASY